MSDQLLTKAEAAARLGISERTIDRMRASGDLPSLVSHGQVRVPEAAVISREQQRAATTGGQP